MPETTDEAQSTDIVHNKIKLNVAFHTAVACAWSQNQWPCHGYGA